MGIIDGVECCELVGVYIQNELGYTFGLYCDDGLTITKSGPREAENIKKKPCKRLHIHIVCTIVL